jgi:hypothetical protein
VGQILSDFGYFSRRVHEEIARARRSGTRFSIAIFTSQPADGELPEFACVQGLPAILGGVRETDTVCRIGRDSIGVLLIDADGDGSRKASLRLLERIGGEVSRWSIRVLEYPEQEGVLTDIGLVA